MLGKLSYKNACYVLFGGLLLFFFAGYQLSFSDTFTLMDAISEKEQKLEWLTQREKELPALRTKMAEFEKAYYNSDSSSVRDKLTAYISDFAENNQCLVTDIPANSLFKNTNLKVQTNTFTIKGNFKNLLQLLFKLENDYKYIAKIMSAHFFTPVNPQSKHKDLCLTIIAQSFEQKLK